MKTIALAAALALANFLLAPPFPAFAQTVSLRSNVMLNDDYLRLGDLFDNAGPKAETVIAQAPRPGKRVTLEARWLASVAQTYGLGWRPFSLNDRSVVERASRNIPIDQIELELMAALASYGIASDAEIELASRQPLVVAAESSGTVAVRDLYYDERQGRFSAILEAPAGAPDAVRARITGRVFTTIRVPVPVRAIGRGDVIGVNDLEWRTVRGELAKRDIVFDESRLVGMAARTSLQPGKPVQRQEVQRPVIVAKGSIVTLAVRTQSMSLTAQGRALEDGSVGDTVRVTNTSSNRTIEGRVEGPNLVAVLPASHVLAN